MNNLRYIILLCFLAEYLSSFAQTYTEKRDWVVGEYQGLRKDSTANGTWDPYTLNIWYFQDFDAADDTTVVTNFNNLSYNYYTENDSILTPFPGIVSANNGRKLFADSTLHFNFVAWGFPIPQGGHMMWFKGKLVQSYVGFKNKLKESLTIHVYPNPSSEFINVTCSNKSIYNELDWDIIDLNGKFVLKDYFNEPSIKINIKELRDGVYFLNIKSKEGVVYKKIVVRH